MKYFQMRFTLEGGICQRVCAATENPSANISTYFTVKSKSELCDRSWIGFVVGLRNACI